MLSLGAPPQKKKRRGARWGGVVWTVVRTWTSRQKIFYKVAIPGLERQTDRQTDRQRQRQRETWTDRDREKYIRAKQRLQHWRTVHP